MKLYTLVTALGLSSAPASALLRFGCAGLTVQRLDPLVNPDMNPSTHLHQIIGGVRDLALARRSPLEPPPPLYSHTRVIEC